MKILLVHNYYREKSGEETYIHSLSQLLKKNKHQVLWYTKNSNQISHSIASYLKVGVNLFYNPSVYKDLSLLIKKNKPDVVQLQNIFPLITPIAYSICNTYKIPIIQRVSNFRLLCPKGTLFRSGKICEDCINKVFPYPAIIHRCYQKSLASSYIFSKALFFYKSARVFDRVNAFIFPTQFVRNYFIQHLSIPIRKTEVIPTFSGLVTTNKRKIKSLRTYFLYIGRLSDEKGIMPLLNVFKTIPMHRLIVIGSGPLQCTVTQYKKYNNIKIMGYVPHTKLSQFYQSAICTIIPSQCYDILPNTLVESLSMGTPVLTPYSPNFFHNINSSNTKLISYYTSEEELIKQINNLNAKKQIIKHSDIIRKSNTFFGAQIHYTKLLKIYKTVTERT